MKPESLHQRAEALLAIHGGSCFVPDDSALNMPFLEMKLAGSVTISHTTFGPISGMEIVAVGHAPISVSQESEI